MIKLITLLIFTFIINIPFGYWRGGEKKFSWQWFVAIHTPVLFLFLLRNYWLNVEYTWVNFPILLGFFFAGQLVGTKWREKRISRHNL